MLSSLRFVPYHLLGATPNVIVDGGPAPSTRLTLSHWPGSPTPVDLLDDLSAQIAFHALERPELFDGIDAVSNNHFDQDGLVSAFVLLHPDEARVRRDRLIDVASAGDFATFRDRDAMRIAFALAALADPDRSPLDAAVFEGDDDEQCGRLYETLLPRLGELVDHPESVQELWQAEDEHLTESLRAIADGTVRVESDPALDLATVSVPESEARQMATRFTTSRSVVVHPAAVHAATNCLRILTVQGSRYRLEMRYETWVMFRSRPVLPRPDLRLLAADLTAIDETEWTADPPRALTPVLQHRGESTLAVDVMRDRVERFLATSPAAWDPYAAR
jgi:hypothetical protein